MVGSWNTYLITQNELMFDCLDGRLYKSGSEVGQLQLWHPLGTIVNIKGLLWQAELVLKHLNPPANSALHYSVISIRCPHKDGK